MNTATDPTPFAGSRTSDVDRQFEDPAQEIKRLQRCIDDLVSLLTLPAVWSSSEPSQIVEVFLDALLRMLSLDFAYACLKDLSTDAPLEVVRVSDSNKLRVSPKEISGMLGNWFGNDDHKVLLPTRKRFGNEEVSIFPLPLGVRGEIGTILAGSERANFPNQTESLLLSVAANQASIRVQENRLLAEQKHVASRLDQRVAERTAELARAHDEIKKSEAKLRQVIDAIPTLAWSTGPGGSADFFNGRWLDYTGMSEEQALGWGWRAAIHPDDVKELIGFWQSSLAAGTPVEVETRLRRFDGEYRWFLVRTSPMRDEQGHIVKWYGINTDIDDRRRAEESLNKARSDLAHVSRLTTLNTLTASIAHEINQPLSGIITNASTCLHMLSANPPNVEGARETARRTIRDGNRVSDVITRLRTFYSKKEFSPELMDLNEAAREVTSLSLSELQRNRVILRQELAYDLPKVVGDRVQLQQVILNLLRNASEAMSTINDRPRELIIKTQRDEGNHVRLSVKDTGVGFTPEVAEKLFEAFYTTKTNGMGIGLSISRSIIQAHHGSLWATPNDGHGVMFSFGVPCKPESSANIKTSTDKR